MFVIEKGRDLFTLIKDVGKKYVASQDKHLKKEVGKLMSGDKRPCYRKERAKKN